MLHYSDELVRRCTLDGYSAGSNTTELKSRMHGVFDTSRVGCAEAMNSGGSLSSMFFCSHRSTQKGKGDILYGTWKRMNLRSDRCKDISCLYR